MSSEFEIGGGWGNAIEWLGDDQFEKKELSAANTFRVAGWKRDKPKRGDFLKAEFVKSHMVFKFTKVEPCGNPRDMFFADVKPFSQTMKQPATSTAPTLPPASEPR